MSLPSPPADHATDAWVVDWLDDSAVSEPASPVNRERVAGHLFLHGLLTQSRFEALREDGVISGVSVPSDDPLSSGDELKPVGSLLNSALGRMDGPEVPSCESTAHLRAMRNVDLVMARLNELLESVQPAAVRTASRGSRLWRLAMSCALAAGLLLAVGMVFAPRNRTAEAAVERALEQVRSNQHREYSVVSRIAGREHRSGLFVHGQAFAFRYPTVLGNDLWLGSDGQDVWYVPAINVLPVLVGDKAELLQRWQQQEKIATPYLNVATVLERLKLQYTLRLLPEDVLPDATGGEQGKAWQHVTGTLREPSAISATTIEMWADPVTGDARRLMLSWNGPLQNKVTFDLVGQPRLEESYYTHSAHHGQRRVVRVE